jgi:hypothetical protein
MYLISVWVLLIGCVEEPVKEDVPEMITKVKLIFTPTAGASIEVVASDPDGEGIQDIKTDIPIVLTRGQSYILSITLLNELADSTSPEYDITDEVNAEGAEHMFFFEWSEGMFSTPVGNGNTDNRSDEVNYLDQDSSGLPVGLNTSWTVGSIQSMGNFRILLKHQPKLKSATSGASAGETDLEVKFNLMIQ